MTDTNRLGRATGKREISTALIAFTRTWIGTYLADAERQHGVTPGTIERPRDYDRIVTLSKWPEVQLPALLVMVPGLAGAPSRKGSGEFFATWHVALIAVLHGTSADDGDLLESVYGAALREMVLNQHKALDGITTLGVDQTDESYDDLPPSRGRSIRAATAEFALQVRGHAQANRPLAAPEPDASGDPGPYPTADTVTVTLTKEP